MDDSRGGYFPTFRDLMLQTDLNNKLGNFLAVAEDYEFVRNMHRKNLIIPVVGDFGGKKAFGPWAITCGKNGFPLTAFYTSNVEQYLFQNEVFAAFAETCGRCRSTIAPLHPLGHRALPAPGATARSPRLYAAAADVGLPERFQ